jgi:hypothetical protein
MSRIYYILIAGVLLLVTIFAFIVRQNSILIKEDKSKGYNAYNQKKDSAETIMHYWKENQERTLAVKSIVYLDYCLMSVYSLLIIYGLNFFAHHQYRKWLQYLLWIGILLIVAGVACDVIQDNAIFQHLTKDRFTDFRYLTRFKFSCILISVLLLIVGMLFYKKLPKQTR